MDLKSQADDPNDRNYSATNLGTWTSISQVDTFLNKFNRATAYKDGNTKLRVGNYVTIQDGSYNQIWEIAGFDVESKQNASDGTIYDNGYGIALIPRTQLTNAKWSSIGSTTIGGYIASTMHTSTLPDIVTYIKRVLGSHIINRNVLLSSSVGKDYYSNGYTWTKADATLMSIGQMTGNFGSNSNIYDDGEAFYKLPIFNSKEYKTGSKFWTRGIRGYQILYINNDGSINAENIGYIYGVRPLIYIR